MVTPGRFSFGNMPLPTQQQEAAIGTDREIPDISRLGSSDAGKDNLSVLRKYFPELDRLGGRDFRMPLHGPQSTAAGDEIIPDWDHRSTAEMAAEMLDNIPGALLSSQPPPIRTECQSFNG